MVLNEVQEMINILKSLLNKNAFPNELDLLYGFIGNTTVNFILKSVPFFH